MYITKLNLDEVLNRFYNQKRFEFLLLFVSSFDNKDEEILRKVVDKAKRIDRITGDRMCFFYFIEGRYDWMNENLTRWVRDLDSFTPLYGEGVEVTMNLADEICRQFGILRSTLPAFILINRNREESPRLYPIHDYNDFEEFLTPINALHSYIEDKDTLLKIYECKKRKVLEAEQEIKGKILQKEKRILQRESWGIALRRMERKHTKELSLGQFQKARKREEEIYKYKRRLDENPLIESPLVESSVERELMVYPHEDLRQIREHLVERLSIILNSHNIGNEIGELIDFGDYSSAVAKIWESVASKPIRITKILERVRMQIKEHGFDVFISCKSQDYRAAQDIYKFLSHNGFKPFLADISIKEAGIDQYTELIGEVINACDRMIVFATQIDYLTTPYVFAEWHAFVNDINSGHKPNAKIISILDPSADIHDLPQWLRDKQCLTIDNYQSDILHFLA